MDIRLIGHQLAKITNLKRKLIDFEMTKFGLSRTSWQVLCSMNTLGSCSQKELLKNLDIDRGHLARVLDNLERNNYITRRQIEGNRRSLFIEITEFAKTNIMPHLNSTMINESSILLDGLSKPEIMELSRLLNKLESNIGLSIAAIKERN